MTLANETPVDPSHLAVYLEKQHRDRDLRKAAVLCGSINKALDELLSAYGRDDAELAEISRQRLVVLYRRAVESFSSTSFQVLVSTSSAASPAADSTEPKREGSLRGAVPRPSVSIGAEDVPPASSASPTSGAVLS